MVAHNRRRAFADVVTVDAWHNGFDGRRKVELHVDVVFGAARVGGQIDDAVRFRLTLRRAEVVIVVPDGEPARVDKASVERSEGAAVNVKSKDSRSSRRSGGAKAKVAIDAGHEGVTPGLSLGIEGGVLAGRELQAIVSRQSGAMLVTQGQTDNGDYRWTVRAATTDLELDGHPWDARTAPRMKVIDTRKDRLKGLTPGLRIEVRCLREDLKISDIEWKDARWAKLKHLPFHENRVRAAEAVIRTKMFEAGLMHGAQDDPYAQMTLAETVVSDE